MKAKFKVGDKIGTLTLLEFTFKHNGLTKRSAWKVECNCGCKNTVRQSQLTSQNLKSCKKCYFISKSLFDGIKAKDLPEWNSWRAMRDRCKHDIRYQKFQICSRWDKFYNFYIDMGPKTGPKQTIDRIDGENGYFPENCRWATMTTQNRNKKRVISIEKARDIKHLLNKNISCSSIAKLLNVSKWVVADISCGRSWKDA